MKLSDVQELDNGAYRIWWRSGGSSVASVGRCYDGTVWMAPANWTAQDAKYPAGIATTKYWGQVRRVERLD